MGTKAAKIVTQSPPSSKEVEQSVLPQGDPAASSGSLFQSLGSVYTPNYSSTPTKGSSQAKSIFGASNTDYKPGTRGLDSQNKGGGIASIFSTPSSGAQSSSTGGSFSFGKPTQPPNTTSISFGGKPAVESTKSPFGGLSQVNSNPLGFPSKSSNRQTKGE